jgi:hypothetical protein
MIDFSELMDDEELGAAPFTLIRETVTHDAEGTPTTTQQRLAATGLVQPPSDDQILMLPEGNRTNNLLVFYTATLVQVGDQKTKQPDVIQYQGRTFRVVRVDSWGNAGYYAAIGQEFVPA